MVAKLLCVFCVFCLPALAWAGCSHDRERCEWMPWEEWSGCSVDCGGGTRTRTRTVCCRRFWGFDRCLRECNLTRNDRIIYDVCNVFCYNGGTPVNWGMCGCPVPFTGGCCNSTDPLTSDYSTSSSTDPLTSEYSTSNSTVRLVFPFRDRLIMVPQRSELKSR